MAAVFVKHVVADTTKVRIFKQITTARVYIMRVRLLLLIPQRYEFSSKSQLSPDTLHSNYCCCWYHKGTNFQANHNIIFASMKVIKVVADTTKVRIFKQITTSIDISLSNKKLLLIPQRYEFSSKSQRFNRNDLRKFCCCWYHKGTNFQANHNGCVLFTLILAVVADTTKVRIFKQITTGAKKIEWQYSLLLIPQRYEFSSKSQHSYRTMHYLRSCCWYHKGTNFQANHNTYCAHW